MTRTLALLLAACLGFWHGPAWALGLGEIEVRSALNERFSASIDLRRVEELSQNEIIASLASADDFSRLGVQRFFYLSELEFTTDLSDPQRPRIVVSSNRPINEPFVNFVVDVRWPTGRMLREYTVLLDPPNYAARPAPAVRPAAQAPSATTARQQPGGERGQVRTEAQPSPGTGRFDGDSYGVTDRDDTLWAIALEVRPSTEVSVHQTMLALQRQNPEAFIGGNINLLKAGYVLEVPDADEIARLSRQDAVLQVAEHNERWRDGTPEMPMDARPELAVGEQPERGTGQLRLVAGEDDEVRAAREATPAGNGVADGQVVDDLRDDLAAAESRLNEAETARRMAEQQRQETAGELEEVSRQLELRNQELARLQRELARQQEAPAPASRSAGQGLFGMSWMLLAGGLLVLVLIVVAVLLLRRRGDRHDDEEPVGEEVVTPASKPIEQTQLMSAISQEDIARASIAEAGAGVAAEAVGTQAASGGEDSDVIAEADVYMAYGRFSEAARVLNSAIETDGQRADLRLKLMEVLVETQDVDAFNEQAEVLRGFADEQTISLVDDLARRLPGAVTSTGATSQGESAGPVRAAEEGEVSLDFDLGDDFGEPADLDSLDIDFDASRQAPAAATDDAPMLLLDDDEASGETATTEVEKATDGEVDLDFDFDESSGGPEPGKTDNSDKTDGLDEDLDLGLDFDDTQTHAAPTNREASSEPAAATGDLDLDLDFPEEDNEEDNEGRLGADDDGAEAPTGVDESPQDVQNSSAADPAFDLTLDESDDIEAARPDATPTGDEGREESADFDRRGSSDQADIAGAPADDESLEQRSATSDDELSFDFDIEDLPAEVASAQSGPSDSAPTADFQGSPTGVDDEDEGIPPLAPSGPDDEEKSEFSLEGFEGDDADSSEASSGGTEELAVDLAEDDLEFGMDFDEPGDETTTKLELARAYIDMGDEDGAKEILDEVVRDGNDSQQQEATELLARLG